MISLLTRRLLIIATRVSATAFLYNLLSRETTAASFRAACQHAAAAVWRVTRYPYPHYMFSAAPPLPAPTLAWRRATLPATLRAAAHATEEERREMGREGRHGGKTVRRREHGSALARFL